MAAVIFLLHTKYETISYETKALRKTHCGSMGKSKLWRESL